MKGGLGRFRNFKYVFFERLKTKLKFYIREYVHFVILNIYVIFTLILYIRKCVRIISILNIHSNFMIIAGLTSTKYRNITTNSF